MASNRTCYYMTAPGPLIVLCEDCAAVHRERIGTLTVLGLTIEHCLRCRARGRKSPQLPKLPR